MTSAQTSRVGSASEPASVWFDPFLDAFPEIAGTKNKPGAAFHEASFTVGCEYDVQRISAEGANGHE